MYISDINLQNFQCCPTVCHDMRSALEQEALGKCISFNVAMFIHGLQGVLSGPGPCFRLSVHLMRKHTWSTEQQWFWMGRSVYVDRQFKMRLFQSMTSGLSPYKRWRYVAHLFYAAASLWRLSLCANSRFTYLLDTKCIFLCVDPFPVSCVERWVCSLYDGNYLHSSNHPEMLQSNFLHVIVL